MWPWSDAPLSRQCCAYERARLQRAMLRPLDAWPRPQGPRPRGLGVPRTPGLGPGASALIGDIKACRVKSYTGGGFPRPNK